MDREAETPPRCIDRGQAHREHVLSTVAKLWEKHPDHSFCDLINEFVIPIGTLAGHTSDEDVMEACGTNTSEEVVVRSPCGA